MIEHLTEIEPSKQRLSYRNSPMGDDTLPLRSYGITDDWPSHAVISLTVQRERKSLENSRDVSLASSTKKPKALGNWQTRLDDEYNNEELVKYNGPGYSLRQSTHLKDQKHNGEHWMMPRWVSQEIPGLFAPVGLGMGGGSMKVK